MSYSSLSNAIDVYMQRRKNSTNDILECESVDLEKLSDQLEKTKNELKSVKDLTLSRPEIPNHKFNRDTMSSLLQNFNHELDSLVKTIKALSIFESNETSVKINEEALKQTLNLVNSLNVISKDWA